MESIEAIQALSALAQTTRMEAFRLLVRREPYGLPAGALARLLDVPANTMSAHLSTMSHAGLVKSERQSRTIVYRAHLSKLRDLILFVLNDCCGGQEDLCASLLGELTGSGGWPPMPGDRLFADRGDKVMADGKFNVLFLCNANSARSIMAESILRKLGAGHFTAYSAGGHPKGEVHPLTLKVLQANEYPVEGLRSKSWDEFLGPDAPKMDFVFTVCETTAQEGCPVMPGGPMLAHWGIDDPTLVDGTEVLKERAFNDACRFLRNRIAAFVALPLDKLDALAMGHRLREIGQLPGAAVPAQ